MARTKAKPRPSDEQIRLWRTWYQNATDPYLTCSCCNERINLTHSAWLPVKLNGDWYLSMRCTNSFCDKCRFADGSRTACRVGVALLTPVRKPTQRPGVDYSRYNSTRSVRQEGDEWRADAAVMPRFDGIYESESESFMGQKVGNLFLRFTEGGQVFSAYSIREAASVAAWLGRNGLDYEATGLTFSTGLYRIKKRKITIELPTSSGGTALTAVATGKINRRGTRIRTASRESRKSGTIKHAYSFRKIKET